MANGYDQAPYELTRTFGVKSGVYHAYKFLWAECGRRDMPALEVITRSDDWHDFKEQAKNANVRLCRKCFGGIA